MPTLKKGLAGGIMRISISTGIRLAVFTGLCLIPIRGLPETYEDYRSHRYVAQQEDKADSEYRTPEERKITKDKPLSEVKASDREELMDDLRGAVRDEIDTTIDKERKASKKVVNKNQLVTDVRRIVREEIEDAIKIKEKTYLQKGTWEVGGFISAQFKGLSGNSADNNYRLNVFPMLNYFVLPNVAIGTKGEASFNLTAGDHNYNIGAGPVFVYGLDRRDQICFYTSIFAGMSYNSSLSDSLGFRYGNEIGLKFVLSSGVIINLGFMIAFDNAGDKVSGFQNILLPTIGITAWF